MARNFANREHILAIESWGNGTKFKGGPRADEGDTLPIVQLATDQGRYPTTSAYGASDPSLRRSGSALSNFTNRLMSQNIQFSARRRCRK